MRKRLITFAAVLLAGGAVSVADANVIAANDFTGDTVPNLAYIQAGRDVVAGERILGNARAVQEDGFLKLPAPVDPFFYTRAKALMELPDQDTNWTLTVVFEYKDISVLDCSFGVTWHDEGAEAALPNQSVRIRRDPGGTWEAIAGRTEAWATAADQAFSDPVAEDEVLTLTIEKTGPSTVNITVDSADQGNLLTMTGVDYGPLGMPTGFGQFAVYNAAFGGPPFNPVWVHSVVLEDDAENVLFADDFTSAEILAENWLVNPIADPIENTLWPEGGPDRPTVIDGALRLAGTQVGNAIYSRAVVNTSIRLEDPIVTAVFDVSDASRPDGGQDGFFGIKIRQSADDNETVVAVIDPTNDEIRVAEGTGFNSFANAVSAAHPVSTGDTVYARVTAEGDEVTFEVADNPAFDTATSVQITGLAGNYLGAGSILFYAFNTNEVFLEEFEISEPSTSVEGWMYY